MEPGSLADRYLRRRGFTPDTVRTLALRDWREQFRILIPFFGGDGDVDYWTARDYVGTSDRKYLNARAPKALYEAGAGGGDAGLGARGHVVLVEGPLDAAACYQAIREHGLDWRAVALGGLTVPEPLQAGLRAIVDRRRVLVWLDTDGPGQRASLTVARLVAPYSGEVVIAVPNWHDSGKDPADHDSNTIAEGLNHVFRD